MKIKNEFLKRQAKNYWKMTRAKEHDLQGLRAWIVYRRYADWLIGIIWENEIELY